MLEQFKFHARIILYILPTLCNFTTRCRVITQTLHFVNGKTVKVLQPRWGACAADVCVWQNIMLFFRYLVEQMKKRDGFTLLREVCGSLNIFQTQYLFTFFFQINFCFTCVNFPPWKAGVCECVFLVYTTESEREGRKYRLPEKTGSGKLGFWRIQRQEPSTWLCVFISKVAPTIKERMMKQGTMMLGYQPLGNRVNFFRVVVLSPLVCQKDMDWFLDEIERLGKDLWLKSWITDHCQCSQWRHLTYWLYRLIITCKRSFLK